MKQKIFTNPSDRMGLLVAERNRKMAASAHAYVRGSTTRFYEWLEGSSRPALPEGPPVWICGDCHVGNLGPIASTDGSLAIQVRDLDQTVIGNPAHDLIRLGLSLAMAARGSDLPGVTTARMLKRMVEGYETAFAPEAQGERRRGERDVTKRVASAVLGRWRSAEIQDWDTNYIDMLGPGHIQLYPDGGHIEFGAVQIGLNCWYSPTGAHFNFQGHDEMTEVRATGTPTSSQMAP